MEKRKSRLLGHDLIANSVIINVYTILIVLRQNEVRQIEL